MIESVGLHSGLPVKIEINAAPVGSGIEFIHNQSRIPATIGHLKSTNRGTTLSGIAVVEHFLSAAYGIGAYDLEVNVYGDELPALDGSAFDELFFVGTLPGRTGLVERGYWVTADGELMCHDEEPADGDYASGMSEVCGRDVTAFEVTYFDGSDWLDRWDGRTGSDQTGQLPKAVHIVLTIGRHTPEQFETIIYIPTS